MSAVTSRPAERRTSADRSNRDDDRVPAWATRFLAGLRPGAGTAVVAACIALACASLALPAVIGYDPWAWLVWGREVTRGTLNAFGGPSWKPLPVLVTTALAPFGDAAPDLWLVVARAGGLFGLVLTYRLAARFAGPAAGVVAAGLLLLTPDDESRWIRLMLQGNIEPLLVALCLGAAERHLAGHRGQAVLLASLAGLLRPEVWPFLGVYALWLLWQQPRRWYVFLLVPAAVPVLWFGGDWLASGNPLAGAVEAQVVVTSRVSRLILAMEQIGGLVVLPVWVAAAIGAIWAAQRRMAPPVVLAVAAVGWLGLVGAMTALLGYAALGRFMTPAAAVLCVLAGIAASWTVTAVRPFALRLLVALALVAAAVPFAVPRAEQVLVQLRAASDWARIEADLDLAVAQAGGRDALLSCGGLAVDATQPADLQSRPAMAWKMDLPLARVLYGKGLGYLPGVEITRIGSVQDVELSTWSEPDVRVLARTSEWAVYAWLCPLK